MRIKKSPKLSASEIKARDGIFTKAALTTAKAKNKMINTNNILADNIFFFELKSGHGIFAVRTIQKRSNKKIQGRI
jgi:hypothetical protein